MHDVINLILGGTVILLFGIGIGICICIKGANKIAEREFKRVENRYKQNK